MTKNISLSIEQARSMYRTTTDSAVKQLIEANFTKEELSEPISSRVTTWESACKALSGKDRYTTYGGSSTQELGSSTWQGTMDISTATEEDTKSVLAYAKLLTLAAVLNEGWVPDYNDSTKTKYAVMRNSDDILVVDSFERYARFGVVFKTKALAQHALKHNEELFRQFLKIK